LAKIAAIGAKVDVHGITRHGFALNIDPDMSYWDGIIGCGLKDDRSARLADFLQPLPLMSEVEQAIITAFQEVFGFQMLEANLDGNRAS
jgi:lipoyl(octanoyl) transferase